MPDVEPKGFPKEHNVKRGPDANFTDQVVLGPSAVSNGQNVYKNLQKIREFEEAQSFASTPLVEYFKKVQKSGMLPKGRGLVRTRQRETAMSLLLDEFFIRQDQADAIASALAPSLFLSVISLRNCGLTDATFAPLMASMNLYALDSLDLS